ncbi:MAG TPA: hypothetical protein ENK57_23565 [Polyangiaceae bacterium]|nr:hypothetical protein [Polyangiaceae bacterium]
MDVSHVRERWLEFERQAALRLCGGAAGEQPREALLELVEKLRREEGGQYTTTFTGLEAMSQRLFVALAERYGLRVSRRKGQRRGTVILQGPETFVEDVFVPLFGQINSVVVRQVDAWLTEAVDASLRDFKPKEPKQLELGSSS